MLQRRALFHWVGAATLLASGVGHAKPVAAKGFRHYPYDPVAASNFLQKLFVPVGSGPFGVLDVAGPLTMRATAASFPILPGKPSPFLLYQTEQSGKAYQNPILRMERGTRLQLTLANELAEPTIIHWHGLHTPAGMDGHPASTIAPGRSFAYDFTVRNRGGTYWYHTHAHNLTAKQAYNGLASFFLVEDEDQRALAQAVDLKLGETDLPLVIQDKQFDAQGKLHYQPNGQEAMMGWLGDIIIVNLTPNAFQTVMPRTYRLRILNGSNARIYRLAFLNRKQRLNYTVIGTDGGLLERPHPATEAFVGPGERLDILFDAGQAQVGDEVFLKSLPFDAMENEGEAGNMPGMPGMGESTSRLAMGAEFNLLKLTVAAGERVLAKLPDTLSTIVPIDLKGATQRNIKLSMQGMNFLINGRTFKMDGIAFDVKRNSREIWSISNPKLGMPHPIHLHGFSFQVIERIRSPKQISAVAKFGKGRTVSDLGWKDTVLVWPGETVRIAIDFTHDFPGDQTYLVHCHNLEHEDAGMMVNYRVVA